MTLAITETKLLPGLAEAIEKRDLPEVERLLDANPDHLFVYTPFAGATWLHFAARNGSREIVEYLISKGFDVNVGDKRQGRSALADAARGGHLEIVKLLLSQGAAIDASSSIRNPLFAAISGSIHFNPTWPPPTGEAPQIVRLLLERGMDSRVRYNSSTMKNMDAVAFAMMMGARDLAHIIALHNSGGDEAAAVEAMAEGVEVAEENTIPVPPGEDVAPS